MISLVIWGCIIMALFFMVTTMVIKGLSALLDTMFNMLWVIVILILGGLIIAAIELIVFIFGGGFWHAFWWIVGIILAGVFISFIGALFILMFEIALFIVTIIYTIIDLILTKLGNWSELGLKFFLGIINQKIFFS